MNPRLYLELAAAVALIGAFWGYSAHERGIGEAKCRADVATAVQAQIADNAEKEAHDKAITDSAQKALEEQLNETQQTANDLRTKLAGQRVCLDFRPRAVPSITVPATISDGAAKDHGSADPVPEDTGGRTLEIIEECQRTTDKLITGQKWFQGIAVSP